MMRRRLSARLGQRCLVWADGAVQILYPLSVFYLWTSDAGKQYVTSNASMRMQGAELIYLQLWAAGVPLLCSTLCEPLLHNAHPPALQLHDSSVEECIQATLWFCRYHRGPVPA